MTQKFSVGVATVATNRYINYWHQLAYSADKNLFCNQELVLHVFTDDVDKAMSIAPELQRTKILATRIPSLTWPEATLLRYEIFDEHKVQFTEDVLMHLDADMIVNAGAGDDLDPLTWVNGMALVRHPGYRRPSGKSLASYYLRNPMKCAKDIYSHIRFGGIGRWDTNRKSQAFVERELRDVYVCGGVWFGRKQEFLALCDLLAQHTREDLKTDYIAVWHDESHLNHFASKNLHSLLGSEYCYATGFSNLADLEPLIIAVDKNDDRTR